MLNAARAAAVIAVAIPAALLTSFRDKPEVHQDAAEHFKYGSIGAEGRAGIPYWIWAALPRMFPQYLPARTGEGYSRWRMTE